MSTTKPTFACAHTYELAQHTQTHTDSTRQTRAHTTPSPHLDRPDRGAHLGYDPIPMASCKGSP